MHSEPVWNDARQCIAIERGRGSLFIRRCIHGDVYTLMSSMRRNVDVRVYH